MNVWFWSFQNLDLDCCASVKTNAFWLWRKFSQLFPLPGSVRHGFHSQSIWILVGNLSVIRKKPPWLSSQQETKCPSNKPCKVTLHCVSQVLKQPLLVGPSTDPWGMSSLSCHQLDFELTTVTPWTQQPHQVFIHLNTGLNNSPICLWMLWEIVSKVLLNYR